MVNFQYQNIKTGAAHFQEPTTIIMILILLQKTMEGGVIFRAILPPDRQEVIAQAAVSEMGEGIENWQINNHA